MVEFFKDNKLVTIANNAKEAFELWKSSKMDNLNIHIYDTNYGNGMAALYAIETVFDVQYSSFVQPPIDYLMDWFTEEMALEDSGSK